MNRQKLINALEIVRPGLSNKEMIEQATCFAFKEGRVITYNDEISISHPIEGLEIEGAVNADNLYKLLSKLKSEDLEITIKEDSELLIKSGKAKAGITLQNEVKLPLEELGEINKWKKIPDELVTAMRFCSFSCSKDMSQPKLTCVHVCENGNVEGCQGYRVTRYKIAIDKKIPSFLIPATSVQQLSQYSFTKINVSEGWVHFRTEDDTIFSCRSFDEEYPDLDEKGLFDLEGVEIKLPKKLSIILEKASIFAKREHILDEEASITLQDNKMKIRTQSNTGWFEEETRIRYTGEETTFIINPMFLQDMASLLEHCVLGSNRIKFTGDKWQHVIALRS